jgi:hypothetical protein
MRTHGFRTVLCVLGFSLGIVLLALLSTSLGRDAERFAVVGICSAGVLFLIEALTLHRRIGLGRERAKLEELRRFFESDKDRKKADSPHSNLTEADRRDRRRRRREIHRLEKSIRTAQRREAWFWRVGASLLLVLTMCIPSLCSPPSHPSEEEQIIIRLLDQIKILIPLHLVPPQGGPTNPDGKQGPLDVTLKLDPALEGLLREHLQRPQASSSVVYWVILIAVFVLAAGLLGWALTKKPEGSAVASAIATLTAVGAVIAKLVGDKPIRPPTHVPELALGVSLVLIVAGIVLIGAGAWLILSSIYKQLFSDSSDAGQKQASPEDAKQKEASIQTGSMLAAALLVYGFSALLLAVVPLLLFGGEPTTVADCSKCPPVTDCSKCKAVISPTNFSVKPLSAIKPLGDGGRPEDKIIDRKKISALAGEVRQYHGQDGDILLLLGSADCTPTRKGGLWKDNDELARARAGWVLDGLKGKLDSIRPKPYALPQYERCAQTLDMRAVYPFLIHAEDDQTGKQH